MGFSSFEKSRKLGTMDEYYDEEHDEEQDEVLSDVVSDSEEEDSDDDDDDQELEKVENNGAFGDMSSLVQELPFKRGLSKHFQGKSQSFTSLANVLCVEDLAKPENPYNKKLKSCKSHGGLLLLSQENQSSRNAMNNVKKGSSSSSTRGSCSSLMNIDERRKIIRPPPPHRSTSSNNFSNQSTPLFA